MYPSCVYYTQPSSLMSVSDARELRAKKASGGVEFDPRVGRAPWENKNGRKITSVNMYHSEGYGRKRRTALLHGVPEFQGIRSCSGVNSIEQREGLWKHNWCF